MAELPDISSPVQSDHCLSFRLDDPEPYPCHILLHGIRHDLNLERVDEGDEKREDLDGCEMTA